jgi:hypothetical protein
MRCFLRDSLVKSNFSTRKWIFFQFKRENYRQNDKGYYSRKRETYTCVGLLTIAHGAESLLRSWQLFSRSISKQLVFLWNSSFLHHINESLTLDAMWFRCIQFTPSHPAELRSFLMTFPIYAFVSVVLPSFRVFEKTLCHLFPSWELQFPPISLALILSSHKLVRITKLLIM